MDILKLFLCLFVVIVSCNAEDQLKNRVKRWKCDHSHSLRAPSHAHNYHHHHRHHEWPYNYYYKHHHRPYHWQNKGITHWGTSPRPKNTWHSHNYQNHRKHNWNVPHHLVNYWHFNHEGQVKTAHEPWIPIQATTTKLPIVEVIPEQPPKPVLQETHIDDTVKTPTDTAKPFVEINLEQNPLVFKNPWVIFGFPNTVTDVSKPTIDTIKSSTEEQSNVPDQSVLVTTPENGIFEEFILTNYTEPEHIGHNEFLDFLDTKLPRNFTVPGEKDNQQNESSTQSIEVPLTTTEEENLAIDERSKQDSQEEQKEDDVTLKKVDDTQDSITPTTIDESSEEDSVSTSTAIPDDFTTASTVSYSVENYIPSSPIEPIFNPEESPDYIVESLNSGEENTKQVQSNPFDYEPEYLPEESTA